VWEFISSQEGVDICDKYLGEGDDTNRYAIMRIADILIEGDQSKVKSKFDSELNSAA